MGDRLTRGLVVEQEAVIRRQNKTPNARDTQAIPGRADALELVFEMSEPDSALARRVEPLRVDHHKSRPSDGLPSPRHVAIVEKVLERKPRAGFTPDPFVHRLLACFARTDARLTHAKTQNLLAGDIGLQATVASDRCQYVHADRGDRRPR